MIASAASGIAARIMASGDSPMREGLGCEFICDMRTEQSRSSSSSKAMLRPLGKILRSST